MRNFPKRFFLQTVLPVALLAGAFFLVNSRTSEKAAPLPAYDRTARETLRTLPILAPRAPDKLYSLSLVRPEGGREDAVPGKKAHPRLGPFKAWSKESGTSRLTPTAVFSWLPGVEMRLETWFKGNSFGPGERIRLSQAPPEQQKDGAVQPGAPAGDKAPDGNSAQQGGKYRAVTSRPDAVAAPQAQLSRGAAYDSGPCSGQGGDLTPEVRGSIPPPDYNFGLNTAQLTNSGPADSFGRTGTHDGKMAPRGILLKPGLDLASAQAEGGLCLWVKSLTADFSYSGVTIYVTNKYPRGSCEHNKVLEHELAHYEIERRTYEEYRSLLARELGRAGIPSGAAPLFTQDPQAGSRDISDRVNGFITSFLTRYNQEIRWRHNKLDSTDRSIEQCSPPATASGFKP